MKIVTLKLLLSLSDSLSMNKIAGSLNYSSAQAVQYNLNKAEEELGFKVFTRNKAGLKLTSKGRVFINRMRPFVSEYERCLLELSDKKKQIIIAYDRIFVLPQITSLHTVTQTAFEYSFFGCNSFQEKIISLSNNATLTFSTYTEGIDYPFVQLSTVGLSVIQSRQNSYEHDSILTKDLEGKTCVCDNRFIWENRYKSLITQQANVKESFIDGITMALRELDQKDHCIIISSPYRRFFDRLENLKITDISDASLPYGFYYNSKITADEAEQIKDELLTLLP